MFVGSGEVKVNVWPLVVCSDSANRQNRLLLWAVGFLTVLPNRRTWKLFIQFQQLYKLLELNE